MKIFGKVWIFKEKYNISLEDKYNIVQLLQDKSLIKENIPVIFLSAKDSTLDKVKGLKLGVEDYITKPFETIELLVRVENVIKRYSKNEMSIIEFKNINFCFKLSGTSC